MLRRGQFTVRGIVQGVCYRYDCREEALGLGLSGWVRNLPDGGVEVVAEGPSEAVAALLAWCRHGPAAAHVESVSEAYGPGTGEFTGFRITH